MLRLIALLAVLLSTATLTQPASAHSTIEIGALLPLSGALASYGEASLAALQDAVDQINARGNQQVTLVVEDTQTTPEAGLARLKVLHGRGINVVIGPYASSQVAAVKAYADEHGILLLSPLSTSRALAIANDNVLRFTPDDEQEGKAVAALALADGVHVIVPVTRDDLGNRGLQDSMQPVYEAAGGTLLPRIVYGPTETNFDDEVAAIAAAVSRERAAGHSVGVYLTAFGEVTALFNAAAAGDPVLQSVKWYGSDSVAQSKELVEDRVAAAFAAATIYPNPILGLSDDQSHLWGPVVRRVSDRLGRVPDAFALAAYDSLNIAYEVLKRVGSRDIERIRRNIVSMAAEYVGLTGPTVLNLAGDRALGNYDFWSVCPTATGYTWIRSATFTASEAGGVARQTYEGC